MAVTSNITEIIFLGFSQSQHVQKVIFVMFLLMYIAVVLGNGLIVVTVMASKGLSSPMYFFLSYLSLVELCYCSVTAPKLIFDSLLKRKVISLQGCITQIFFLHFFGGTEIFLLTVMAYLQAFALCHHHESKSMWAPGRCSMEWGLVAFCWTSVPHFPTALLWFQHH